MTKAHVLFKKIIVDSQQYRCLEPDDDHMISRLFFDLEVGGNLYYDMKVEVKQPYGTQFESNPLEVSQLIGPYTDNWHHNNFSELVEKYYRSLIGKEGIIKTAVKAKDTYFENLVYKLTEEFDFDIPDK